MTADDVIIGIVGAGAFILLQVLWKVVTGPHGRKAEFREVFGCLPGDSNASLRVAAWVAYLTTRVSELAQEAEDTITPGAPGFVGDPNERWSKVAKLAEDLKNAQWRLQKAVNLSDLCELDSEETEVVKKGKAALSATPAAA